MVWVIQIHATDIAVFQRFVNFINIQSNSPSFLRYIPRFLHFEEQYCFLLFHPMSGNSFSHTRHFVVVIVYGVFLLLLILYTLNDFYFKINLPISPVSHSEDFQISQAIHIHGSYHMLPYTSMNFRRCHNRGLISHLSRSQDSCLIFLFQIS